MPVPPNPPDTWSGLLVLPENRSAVRAAERLVKAFRNDANGPRFARPLVFHGPIGCGKSVIVREVVQQAIEIDQSRTAQILSGAELPRDPDELNALRSVDLLALEDVQHVKPADLESFLILLDARCSRRMPTLITASAGPASLLDLPRRITNRLAAGLVIRLDAFGNSSRSRFALWYSERVSVRFTSEALDWLANHTESLRQLTGMIDTLRSTSASRKGELTATQVQVLLASPLLPTTPLERITRTVADAFRVKPKELIGSSRLRTVLIPRQVAMYLGREVAKLPLAAIGKYFGNRDHTTVLNAVRKIEVALEDDVDLAGRVRELRRGLE